MSESVSVSKIVIEIGKKKLELTPDELRELREVLDITFPKEKVIHVQGQPIIIEKPVYKEPPWWPYKRWMGPYWSTQDGQTTCSIKAAS